MSKRVQAGLCTICCKYTTHSHFRYLRNQHGPLCGDSRVRRKRTRPLGRRRSANPSAAAPTSAAPAAAPSAPPPSAACRCGRPGARSVCKCSQLGRIRGMAGSGWMSNFSGMVGSRTGHD